MAGVTDTVFRRFIRHASLYTPEVISGTTDIDTETTNERSGCGLMMTEFTSADGLSRMRETKRKRYLTYYEDEHPISAQIFGSNPVTLAESARIIQDAGFDLVDLNLGCPAKRVVKCNGGSGLLRDLPLIEEIFKQVRAAVTIPFTVKFRMGWNDAQHRLRRAGQAGRRLRTERRRAPCPYPRAGLYRRRALGVDRRRQGRRQASRSSATATCVRLRTPPPWSAPPAATP